MNEFGMWSASTENIPVDLQSNRMAYIKFKHYPLQQQQNYRKIWKKSQTHTNIHHTHSETDTKRMVDNQREWHIKKFGDAQGGVYVCVCVCIRHYCKEKWIVYHPDFKPDRVEVWICLFFVVVVVLRRRRRSLRKRSECGIHNWW